MKIHLEKVGGVSIRSSIRNVVTMVELVYENYTKGIFATKESLDLSNFKKVSDTFGIDCYLKLDNIEPFFTSIEVAITGEISLYTKFNTVVRSIIILPEFIKELSILKLWFPTQYIVIIAL